MQGVRSAHAIPVMVATACLLTVAALAANLNSVRIAPGGSSPGSFFPDIIGFIFPMTVALWSIVMLGILLQFKRGGSGARERGRMSGATFWGLAICLGIIIISSLAVQNGWSLQNGGDPSGGGSDLPGQDGDLGSETTPPPNMWSLIPLAGILAVIFLLTNRSLKGRILGKGRSPKASVDDVQAVGDASSALANSKDVRGSILLAYLNMCSLAREPRSHQDPLTPGQLEEELVKSRHWPAAPVRRLTAVFEEARYSDHLLGEEHRATALQSLDEIERKLGGRET